MPVSLETSIRLQELRQKQARGEPLTLEECKEVVLKLREDRQAASATVTKNKTTRAKKSVETVDSDKLIDDLFNS